MHGLESAGSTDTDPVEEGRQKPSALSCNSVTLTGGVFRLILKLQ